MKTIEGKIVVLGAQGVGKTSMVVRYIGKMFSHHISPTIGASFFTCKINVEDARVKLQVWDTAGQERFRSMAPMYYRNANAALLVFDITQYHTFTSVKTWVKELQRNVEEPMVLCLVGNKVDLASQRKVSRDEAFQYSTSIGSLYFEASALQDQAGRKGFPSGNAPYNLTPSCPSGKASEREVYVVVDPPQRPHFGGLRNLTGDAGIEDVFLSVALGLVKLAQDPTQRTSIKVYEGQPGVHPVLDQKEEDSALPNVIGSPNIARADAERSVWCC